MCESKTKDTSVRSTSSSNTLASQASQWEIGYKSEVEVGIEAGPASISTTVENGIKYG